MVSSSQKPQAQLRIPQIPKFPFSSPITEEIASPTSSSPDDREMERNRPFEFLSKMSSRSPFAYKLDAERPREEEEDDEGDDDDDKKERGISYTSQTQGKTGGSLDPYTRRKNTERPVGLNLVTDLSRPNPNGRKELAAAPFVDLNDLIVLSQEREEERSAAKGIKGILKKGDNHGFQRLPDDPASPRGSKRASWLNAVSRSSKRKPKDDLSPSDRPIVIGYSVPFNESPQSQEEKSRELDSAGTQQTPLTPSIIVTPAREDTFWPGLSPENTRPRAASSVYSQPTPYLGSEPPDIPPVPALPAFFSTSNNEGKSSDIAHGLSVDSIRKRRSYSTGAVNKREEEEQPAGRTRAYSNENGRLSINTQMNRHASYGWWNYLLSPLLSRTSTILSRGTPTKTKRPPMPTIETSSSSLTDEWWEEKEVSYFSPDTPDVVEAHRGIVPSWQNTDGNPFADFDWSIDDQQENSRERGTASFMFSGERIQGAAAEYYQACAHELFSGKPYFECINHVCSLTPRDKIPSSDATPPQGDTQEERNALIDLDDVPRDRAMDFPKSSPVTSINSDSFEEEAVAIRGLSAPLSSSRHEKAPTDDVHESPKPDSPLPDSHGSARAPDPILGGENEKQSSNPFLQQPREEAPPVTNVYYIQKPSAPQPVTNVHVQAPPPQPPTDVYVPPPAAQPPPPIPIPSLEQLPPPSYGVQPRSPYPASSESLQEATERGGSIPMSEMPPGPAPAYTSHDNSPGVLPARVRAAPITRDLMTHPVEERDRIENHRRRLEREDEIGRKAGGLWRGRGCFSNKGCFGRPGREGRLRRRWYLAIFIAFLLIVLGAVLLAIFLTRSGDDTPVQSQWLNLTGYPPMPTGISTIAGPEAQVQDSGCINPSTLWSCALPKEQQADNKPYAANQPNFRVEIRFQNGTYNRSTAIASRSIQMLTSRSANQLYNPSPSPPSIAEQTFLGNTTDGNSVPYAGEETPFYITILSPSSLSSSQLSRRSDSNSFPDLASLIPSPALNSDGTAAAAVLYPLPSSQPIRLYNRGQDNEHYGFYTYFDKSIFLSSSTPLTGQTDNNNTTTTDTNGGSNKADARVQCTWSQTRFLIQIWTNPQKSGKSLLQNISTTTSPTASASATATPTSQATPLSSATDFTRPGSFPYPVTITLDRHGGAATKKMVYCYGMESDQHVNGTEKKFQIEDRGFNGRLVNPAPGIFNLTASSSSSSSSDDSNYGGYDGGTGGCSCQWVNWVGSV